MKSSFILPSCNYNISISKAELQELMETGHLSAVVSRVPCKTGRYIYDDSNNKFELLGNREACNNLCFRLDRPVADIEDLDWHVQFLTINVRKEE